MYIQWGGVILLLSVVASKAEDESSFPTESLAVSLAVLHSLQLKQIKQVLMHLLTKKDSPSGAAC